MPDFVGIFERKLDSELEIRPLGTFLLKETMAEYNLEEMWEMYWIQQYLIRCRLDLQLLIHLSVAWRDPAHGRGHTCVARFRELLVRVEIILGKVGPHSVLPSYPSRAISSRIYKVLWKCTMGFNLIQIYITIYFYSCSKLAIMWSAFLGNTFTRGKTSSRTLIRILREEAAIFHPSVLCWSIMNSAHKLRTKLFLTRLSSLKTGLDIKRRPC